MNKLTRDFVSEEKRQYDFKFGQVIASSLFGFICGSVVASMIWIVILEYLNVF